MNAVARALAILHSFDGAEVVLGNHQIAARTGLAKSTVARLTHTLLRTGHLARVPHGDGYRLGIGTLTFASTALRGLELRRVIRGCLAEIAALVPGTIGLAARDGLEMVYLDYARAAHVLSLHSTIGSRVPLAETAAGRAWIIAQPRSEQENVLASLAERDAAAARALSTWLDDYRSRFTRDGYVISCGAWNPYVNGVGVPVFFPTYGATMVLVAGVLAAEYDRERLDREVAPLLRDLATRLARLEDQIK
ncbi:IclR family transcriptional regulator [Acidibrevibacterium fodinaquatile]|uniref:IclR family transcriptional regulator n=1 Tax=Acidibrevibacterium fodinaquatile TaxID=1969806 RepID=UPI0013B3EE0B|nr:helix-turn-helix domain-containing protein [Acidibrevibacterium fodinaquatile]